MNCNSKSLGLAGGILWGISMLVLTLLAVKTGYALGFMNLMTEVYPGYSVSATGSLIGLIYGFVDGFIGGYVFASLYNWLNKKV